VQFQLCLRSPNLPVIEALMTVWPCEPAFTGAKLQVMAANAASVGYALLSVPLLYCSGSCNAKSNSRSARLVSRDAQSSLQQFDLLQWLSGLVAEAAAVLQDAALWRYAATLAAGPLPPATQAALLDRCLTHALQVGILSCGGGVRAGLLHLF
jgi:hypothetical protein